MLRTEADVVRALTRGTYTLDEIYECCKQRADISRAHGLRPPSPHHRHDTRWRHRVRCALQTLKAAGDARKLRRSVWLLEGSPARPRRMLLVTGGDPAEFELRLADAVELLRTLEEPADLIVCDPPYGLSRDTAATHSVYAADSTRIIPGYRDVPSRDYTSFSARWVSAAAAALRPGGQLAVVTGPDQAWHVGYAADRAGLSTVSTIAAFKTFALRATRRPATSHWTVSAFCKGARDRPDRTFNAPRDLPPARSGRAYPLDWWPENGRVARRGLLRYDNQLPIRLVLRIVEAFSARGDLVVDAFVGGGTTAEACLRSGRRFVGGDVNPNALRFTAARLLEEHLWAEERAPRLPIAA